MIGPRAREPIPADRRDAIVRLLKTLLDGLPTSNARPLSAAGFVHDAPARESCPDCLANDRVMFGCESCGGRGFVESRRRRDPYDTGRTSGFALVFGQEGREAAARRDREIDLLGRQTAPPRPESDQLAEANARGEPWELERDRMRRDFDYEPLERGLEVLRLVDEDAYRAVFAVHVYGWAPDEGAAAAAAARGVELLDPFLPACVRAPVLVVLLPSERSRLGRNIRIRERFDDGRGVSVKALAREHGLSVSQVNRILNGDDGAE